MHVEFRKSLYNDGYDLVINGSEFKDSRKYDAVNETLKYILKSFTRDCNHFSLPAYTSAYRVVQNAGAVVFSLRTCPDDIIRCEVFVENPKRTIEICRWNPVTEHYDMYGQTRKDNEGGEE